MSDVQVIRQGRGPRKIVIDPVTRVEGHGKVTIRLNEAGEVEQARFHIVEFRGFERFIHGRMYWEVPVIVQRLCGICPVSHHLGAGKAMDVIAGVDQADADGGKDAAADALRPGAAVQRRQLLPSGLARPPARIRGAGRAAQHHRRDRSLPRGRQVGDLHPQIRPAGDRRDRRPAHPSAAVHPGRRQPEPVGGAPRCAPQGHRPDHPVVRRRAGTAQILRPLA